MVLGLELVPGPLGDVEAEQVVVGLGQVARQAHAQGSAEAVVVAEGDRRARHVEGADMGPDEGQGAQGLQVDAADQARQVDPVAGVEHAAVGVEAALAVVARSRDRVGQVHEVGLERAVHEQAALDVAAVDPEHRARHVGAGVGALEVDRGVDVADGAAEHDRSVARMGSGPGEVDAADQAFDLLVIGGVDVVGQAVGGPAVVGRPAGPVAHRLHPDARLGLALAGRDVAVEGVAHVGLALEPRRGRVPDVLGGRDQRGELEGLGLRRADQVGRMGPGVVRQLVAEQAARIEGPAVEVGVVVAGVRVEHEVALAAGALDHQDALGVVGALAGVDVVDQHMGRAARGGDRQGVGRGAGSAEVGVDRQFGRA